jgi:hypothetical protein
MSVARERSTTETEEPLYEWSDDPLNMPMEVLRLTLKSMQKITYNLARCAEETIQ